MVNSFTLRLSSLVPGPLAGARSALTTETDGHAGKAPPPHEAPGASPERTPRVPDNAIPESVVDVALALVLNEIAHQARSITNAAGSAVLLIRGGVPVCRSTSGATAREASAYLSECYGLAWRNGAPQRPHDAPLGHRLSHRRRAHRGVGGVSHAVLLRRHRPARRNGRLTPAPGTPAP